MIVVGKSHTILMLTTQKTQFGKEDAVLKARIGTIMALKYQASLQGLLNELNYLIPIKRYFNHLLVFFFTPMASLYMALRYSFITGKRAKVRQPGRIYLRV